MRKVWKNAIAVGLLTCFTAAAIYESVIYLSEEYAEEAISYYALFHDATGLNENSYVKIAGLQVGSITKISLEVGFARVDIKVSKKYPLYENAILYKKSSSIITGDYYLALNPGSPDRKRIPPGGRIKHVEEGTEMEAMASRLDEITKDLKAMTASLREVFATPEGQERINQIVENLKNIAEHLSDLLAKNSQLVDKTITNIEGITKESRPQLREILSNMKTITGDIKEIIKSQESQVGETVTDLKGSVKTLNSALNKLDKALGNIEGATEDIKNEKGVVGKLISSEEIGELVENAVEGAGGFLKSLSRLQTIVSLRSDYNFLSATLKTYVAVYIQPKEDKFYLVEVVDDPRGKTEVEELTVETTNLNEPAQWHEKRIKRTAAYKFSFMFGRRISFITFRFGIKESTGGIGFDLFFLKDSLKIEMDLFDFGTNVYPRWKVAAALRFLRKIYVLGGVDDILNKGQRDYFIGAQLKFNDEDLKAVLTFTPSPSMK